MVITLYDELATFAKILYSVYVGNRIPLSTVNIALSKGKITQEEYDFIILKGVPA